MIRHISVFIFHNTPEKQAHIDKVRTYLETIPALYPDIVRQTIAVPAAPTPELPDDAPIQFGDLIQVADFSSPEAAAGYPSSKAHIGLTECSGPYMKKVVAIDYVIED